MNPDVLAAITRLRVEGVLSVELPPDSVLPPEQRELLEAFATQLAVIAENDRLASVQQRSLVLAESERLQKTLFDSVSHELKTPIAAISAALEQPAIDRSELARANDRLRRTVEHLLDATRLETGLLKASREWCDPVELAREAITRAGVPEDQIQLEETRELPAIRVDSALIAQALSILLHNAFTYGRSSEPILLRIEKEHDFMCFEVSDRGPGLPRGWEERIFEKFQRAPGSPAGGIGLGLSIARYLAEVHGGTLVGANRTGGGARFRLRLPTGGPLHLPE